MSATNHAFVLVSLALALVAATTDALKFGKQEEPEDTCTSEQHGFFDDENILKMIALMAAFTGSCCYFVYETLFQTFQRKINELQVQLSGKTNSAFVFIKPHACKGNPGMVEAVVEDGLKKAGIRITDQGEISAETIDSKMYIDTHYGAIASKAVKLKPSELNVPDKGKAGFQTMFGESWDDAIAAGKVYNAMDGAAKLGVDAMELGAKWRKLETGKNLIKFGGGFYCGKIDDDIYVMNAFYMAMRAGE